MDYLLMWLLVQLDSIKDAEMVILILSGVFVVIAAVFTGCGYSSPQESWREKAASYFRKSIGMFVCSLLLFAATPHTKQAAAIYLIPTIVNNEKIKTIAGNSLGILEEYTKQYLDSLTHKEVKK